MEDASIIILFLFVLFLLLGTGVWVGLALMGVAWVGMELFTTRPVGDVMLTTVWSASSSVRFWSRTSSSSASQMGSMSPAPRATNQPVGPLTADSMGQHGIRMYPDQDPEVLEETRRYFEKLAEHFSHDLAKA